MKTSSEHEQLLNELFAESATHEFRAGTLDRSLTLLRRRRRTRVLARSAAAIIVPALIVIGVLFSRRPMPETAQHASSATTSSTETSQSPRVVPGTDIRILTDDELLDLFPGRPLALVGPKDNRRLIFLDEVQ